jgi:RNA polymerase sigma-70 factor (TIGR02943 family)
MNTNHEHAVRPDPEQWVDRYGNMMYRYALSRLSNPETAQDLVQEALAAAVQSYENFQGRSSTKTWLIAILKRKIVDHYRQLSNRQETDDIESVADSMQNLFDQTGHWRVMPSAWQVNPADVYEQKEFINVLYACVSKLPSRLAEIFMLREFEEMDTQAICDKLNITESNCWVILYRARMQLRGCLENNWLDIRKKE